MPRSRIILVAALAALVPGLAALLFWGADGSAGRPLHATVLPEPLPLPEFALRDQHDEPFTRDRLRGRASLLFFGFTHCPDICPATLQQLTLARKQIAEASHDRTGSLPQIVLISVDPERDTSARLAQYVSHFGEGVDAATGSPEAVSEFTSALGIFFEKEAPGEGDYTVSHSTAVLFVDEEAALSAVFSAPHKSEHFVHDVPLLMAAR
ncbi:MAG TPA: SCO family protein [Woeseiaceae bacterium]